MAIPQGFIQELIGRVDIVEVVGRHVALKKGGANYMGLCPFHGEKSPSFSVSPTKQFYHCFGCGKNGNAIGFLMDHTGAGFVEVVKDLAQQVGLSVPEEEASPQERAHAAEQREKALGLTDLLEQAVQAYRRQLKDSPRAIEYLKKRGLSGDIAKRFGLGYAPEGWRFLSTVFPDYQSPVLVEAGLVIASDSEPATGATETAAPREGKRYDRFRDRVMFPIRNVKGQCIGFGGRVLDQGEPKYLNSPETPVFSKGHELYGLFEARTAIRQAGHALVTEGYMDVVALAQLGFAQAVATLGTACTADHLRLLFRFTDAVVFAFDGDAAGRRAARKALDVALPWASDTRNIKFLFLPPEHDPDSYIREHGADAFAQCIQDATPLSRFLLEAAASGCALDTAEGRARLASQAQPMWGALPDGALKRQLLGDLADQIGLELRELQSLWHTATAPGRGGRRTAPEPHTAPSSRTSDAAQPGGRPPGRPRDTDHRSTWSPAGSRSPRRSGLLDRADRVARTVLTLPGAWDWLSADDHHLLCEQSSPHGPLFAWLDSQWHEHGAQSWAALREGLRGQAFENWAVALVEAALHLEAPPDGDAPPTDTPSPPSPISGTDKRHELQELLRRLRIEALKRQETETIAQAAQDPSAMERYRQLQAQRKALEHGNPEPPV